ncbi:hypothetical protein KKD37_03000 [Patescibacteria group bacterium]|nr:hypothetical protein [Patescibacteria group bacterium]
MSGNTELPQKITDILTQVNPSSHKDFNDHFVCMPIATRRVSISVTPEYKSLYEKFLTISTIAAYSCPEYRGNSSNVCEVTNQACPNTKRE